MSNNKKTPATYDQHLQNMMGKKEALPFHKMDDIGRRKFIQSVGMFLSVLTVPSMIRLETMSKISKKIFGNSMAFAAAVDSTEIILAFYARSGYGFVPWIVGCASDNNAAVNPADRNVAWDPDLATSNPTANGEAVILPPHSAGLAPYVDGIQGIQCFASMGGHTDMFNSTYQSGVCELIAATSKTQTDAGLQTLLTQPFGYYSMNDFGVQNVPSTLAQYVPSAYSNTSTVASLFTPPVLTTTEGNQLSATLQKNILSVMQGAFSKDVGKAVYDTNKEIIDASNKQAYKILATNYQSALDPAQNAATINQLTAGLPTQTRMNTNVNAANAIFQIITAANLGITPRIGMLGLGTSDWHDQAAIFTPGDPAAGDQRTQSAAWASTFIKNILDTVSGGAWTNSATGNSEHVKIIWGSEFIRTNTSNNGTDDGDGGNNGSLVFSTKLNNPGFKAGSYGKVSTSGQTMGYNPSNNTHSTNISPFTTMQLFVHNAQLFGVDLDAFGITANGIGGDMVDT